MSHPVFDIRGKVALVTGSSRGIGNALAHGLAEAGCVVVLNGRDPATMDTARRATAEQTGATVLAEAFDVTDHDAVAAGIARIEDRAGPLDILVNNAGMQHRAPFTEFRTEDWNRLLETNLSSAFLVGRETARRMAERGRGKIVNICSVQSALARPGITPYTATKGGLKMLTKGMCADLGPSGIQVNGLAPGYFDTELNAALVADEQFSDWIRTRTPAGRWGKVEDLVGTLLFLCSPASDFVNGQIVYVDGGMTSVL
ncbi:SDR family oxidoreductase [Amycolatopsis echigonensis]|uniref:Gluconate 5-dehydrogenase n=1 Tax=Amycolatopsis echigonensis TaxID=2576905 RepID=A0A2N3WRC4_9PSEU|nr:MULTISPECIES: SDR family oxidoreductase [Amycolatopsis]MBB2505382.1 SDR family oxidoreductase [Amycolatopsis echigonensis]PKV96409.1 gluconate 5-dehydrogenase [Amycolatopsis niigatensis]